LEMAVSLSTGDAITAVIDRLRNGPADADKLRAVVLDDMQKQGTMDQITTEVKSAVDHFLRNLPASTDRQDRHLVKRVIHEVERSRVSFVIDDAMHHVLNQGGLRRTIDVSSTAAVGAAPPPERRWRGRVRVAAAMWLPRPPHPPRHFTSVCSRTWSWLCPPPLLTHSHTFPCTCIAGRGA
jgi:hypothetical protein